MSNPNRTVAAFRNRKMIKIAEITATSKTAAEVLADSIRPTLDKDQTVRVASYKYGSWKHPTREWLVRTYERVRSDNGL